MEQVTKYCEKMHQRFIYIFACTPLSIEFHIHSKWTNPYEAPNVEFFFYRFM